MLDQFVCEIGNLWRFLIIPSKLILGDQGDTQTNLGSIWYRSQSVDFRGFLFHKQETGRALKVRKSRKQFMVSSILPKNELNSLLRQTQFVYFWGNEKKYFSHMYFGPYWPLGRTIFWLDSMALCTDSVGYVSDYFAHPALCEAQIAISTSPV